MAVASERDKGATAHDSRPFIAPTVASDIEVRYEPCIRLDEQPPRLHFIAHQPREDVVGLYCIMDVDLDKRTTLRIHRCVPELLRIHLAEPLVALDVQRGLPVAVTKARGDLVALLHAVRVIRFLALRDAEEGRLRDVHVA